MDTVSEQFNYTSDNNIENNIENNIIINNQYEKNIDISNVNVNENENVNVNVTEIVPSSGNLSIHAAANLSGHAPSPNNGSMMNASDLLPEGDAGNVNLLGTGVALARFGIDTAGPNKNGLRDLRSAPPIPVKQQGPWHHPSSAGPDLLRRPLEEYQ